MIDFYVGPCVAVVRALLQVERVVLVRLRRRAGHQTVEDRWVALDSRAKWGNVPIWSVEM